MRKLILIFGVVLVAVVGFCLFSGFGEAFVDAARHGGSPAARERRLAEISRKVNEGLPRQEGELTRLEKTTVGPGLTFTLVYKFPDHSVAQVDPAKLAGTAKTKAIKAYTNNLAMADFRKWQVELRFQYLDRDGRDITTVAVSTKDL
jgi:hypothetical protein